MCGCDLPYVPDSKDLVAIIHPAFRNQHASDAFSRTLRGRLMISNRYAGITTSEFLPAEQVCMSMRERKVFHVRIHKYGQPIDSDFKRNDQSDVSNPIIHSFPATSLTGAIANSQLDLGVGGDGIIGRTVSITDADSQLLGQGIIGRI